MTSVILIQLLLKFCVNVMLSVADERVLSRKIRRNLERIVLIQLFSFLILNTSIYKIKLRIVVKLTITDKWNGLQQI